MSPTVLFVGHAADRTGPPIGLLHLARWLHAQGAVTLEFLLLEGGPLVPDYEALGTTVVLEEWRLDGPWGALATLAEGRAHRLLPSVRRRALARRLRPLTPPDLVYVNTAWTIRALRHLLLPVPSLVVAIHELEVGLDLHLPPEEHEVLFGQPDHLIAVSEAVRANAVAHHGVDPADVSVHYEMIEVQPSDPEASAGVRRTLGIPEDAVVVGSAGLTHWRKASDLFLLVARDVLAQRPDLHVVWVGGDADDPDTAVFRDDIARSGVADRIHLVAHVADPLPWYGAMDVFVLTAREDAFPLVCLEAGSVGVPIVCFDNGGMPELVDRGTESCGYVVPYPDLAAMAARIVDLADDGDLRRQLGERARVTVGREFDVGAVAPELWADVRRFLP